jgi:predicted metal-dependent HD superfamily phosphohydrolase
MDNHKIEKRVEEYVTSLFEKLHSPSLAFHNIDHTRSVVKHCEEIAQNYNLKENEWLVLKSAAWFHDTGYLFTEPAKHEETSCEVMRKFMKDLTDEQTVNEIEGAIMATKFPTHPQSLVSQILCDADTYNFGTKDFKETNKKAFEEAMLRDPDTQKEKFLKNTINLLESHSYYTSYCQQQLDARKQKNLQKLEKKLRKVQEEGDKEDKPETADLSDVEKDKNGLMSKGIQTMLRLTSANHLRLSELADHKANILISVNAIIISVILSVLLRKLQEETYLIIPTIIFLVVAVVTIVLSILATRPKISGGNFTMDEVREKKTNLLFFGNFYKATYEQYDEAMRQMMLDTDYLYGSLIKDIYYLGAVLGRKYKLLRIAYNIFMIGIVVSVIAFAIAAFFNNGSTGTVINGTGSPF